MRIEELRRLQALIAEMRTEAAETDADGDFCCALTRRNDADDLETIVRACAVSQPQPLLEPTRTHLGWLLAKVMKDPNYPEARPIWERYCDWMDQACAPCECAALSSPPREWQLIDSAPENVPVLTRIDDRCGIRNERLLKRRGHLWWLTDGSTYVHYRPTHWMPLPEPSSA